MVGTLGVLEEGISVRELYLLVSLFNPYRVEEVGSIESEVVEIGSLIELSLDKNLFTMEKITSQSKS